MTPVRIQRQRTKGWRMPEGAVYVGRPSRWGNPFRFKLGHYMGVRELLSRPVAVDLYRRAARFWAEDPDFLHPLRGRDLVCWCPLDQPCHADVLLDLVS